MVPPKSDAKWTKFLSNLGTIKATDLSARMLINRLKLRLNFDHSDPVKLQSISDAYDFFIKNEIALKDDIKLIFA
jgi:hypothetical protein